MKTSDAIKGFLDFLREAESEQRINLTRIELYQKQVQDINHRLELHNDPYHVRGKLNKALTQALRSRRIAKNYVEINDPVIRWIDDNKDVIHRLENLLGTVRRLESNQAKKVYTERTDIVKETLGDDYE